MMREVALRPEEDLPAPSAELILLRTVLLCFLATCRRKQAERFLRLMAETLAAEQNLADVLQLKPCGPHREIRLSRQQAAVVFERWLPMLLAGLPDD